VGYVLLGGGGKAYAGIIKKKFKEKVLKKQKGRESDQ